MVPAKVRLKLTVAKQLKDAAPSVQKARKRLESPSKPQGASRRPPGRPGRSQAPEASQTPKRRGRPPGSKNKSRA